MPTQPKPTPTSTNASTPTDKPPALSPITPQTTTPLQLTLHHLHTLLPLLLLVSTFRPLVSNPPATLLTLLLPPLAITQSLYIAICLPPSAGTASITPTSSKPKKNHAQTKNWTSRVVVRTSPPFPPFPPPITYQLTRTANPNISHLRPHTPTPPPLHLTYRARRSADVALGTHIPPRHAPISLSNAGTLLHPWAFGPLVASNRLVIRAGG